MISHYQLFDHSRVYAYIRCMINEASVAHITAHKEIFICPSCGGGNLRISESFVQCLQCQKIYPITDGIPQLFTEHSVRSSGENVIYEIKEFYEQYPFPNYDGVEGVPDLMSKAAKSLFADSLNRQISFNTRILEVGCGTGQLANYLGIAQRFVFGTDMCLSSLKLAQGFKVRNGLNRVGFYQMNLFKPIFRPSSFDLVICSGVLHHTEDPLGGFRSIGSLVKPGGHIIIGLYNIFGRVGTDVRRFIFRMFGERLSFLDPHLRKNVMDKTKKRVWFMDQYKNPHESKHSIGEALRWFKDAGFAFTYGIPKPKPGSPVLPEDHLFNPQDEGSALDHFLVQAGFLLAGSKEGGLFIVIGKKKSAA